MLNLNRVTATLALMILIPAGIARAQPAVRLRAAAPQPATTTTTAPAPTDEDERNAPTTRKLDLPKGSFQLVEWVVLLIDPNRTNANDAASFKSTWPGFARGRRSAPGETLQGRIPPGRRRGMPVPPTPAASAEALKNPSPVGVIRLFGKADQDDSIDVLIQVPNGRLLQYWPQGKPKTNRELWEKLALKPGPMQVVPADAGTWFDTLRRGGDGAASMISTPRWTERFLMYDAEFPYPNQLRVKAAGKSGDAATAGKYQLANAGGFPMRDVEVYSPAPGGWRVAGLKELPSSKPQPATQGSAGAAPQKLSAPPGPGTDAIKQIFSEAVGNKAVEVKVDGSAEKKGLKASTKPTTRPTSRASTHPTTKPGQPATAGGDVPKDSWRDLAIPAGAKALSAEDAVAPWRKRLSDAGLTPADVDVILATLRTQALDDEQLTVVYRLDPAELDKLLPLEVVPVPAKTTRVGLAIVINIDPAEGERIAKLIAQMGDPAWSKREAAYAQLSELGAGAKPKLIEATKSSDIEIVYRAERLLDAINNPQ